VYEITLEQVTTGVETLEASELEADLVKLTLKHEFENVI
jgi:hypothetical protein